MSKDADIRPAPPNFPAFHVLIAAAGSGLRAGLNCPKQYAEIAGKTVLRHTIEKFLGLKGLKSIRAVIDPAHRPWYDNAVQGLDLAPPILGSETRKQSVYNGLQSFSKADQDDLILIHDAARPFVTHTTIHKLLHSLKTANAATLVTPVADTLVDRSYGVTDRNALHAVQTPQGFHLSLLTKAHDHFKNDDRFTDDAGLVAALGEPVTLIPGSRDNFKITTAEDLAMAERLLSPVTETRTGFGYDVHAFDPAPATTIRLGGIDIPHTRKLLGHSDADVILHALTDALLGTIGDGDIGQLFPPSDPSWKNADSAIFIAEAVRRVCAQGGTIIHADITLIAEEPKIGPHRDKMQARLAVLLGLAQNRVGLKATTSEGLGFTGRREGIVAQAVVSVTFPV